MKRFPERKGNLRLWKFDVEKRSHTIREKTAWYVLRDNEFKNTCFKLERLAALFAVYGKGYPPFQTW